MKKFLLTTILLLAFSTNGFCGIITIDSLSSDSSVTYTYFNNAFNAIKNTVNGGVSTQNIEDDSLTEADFADEINPRVRDNEQIGDFTYTGMLPVTSANLTSNISAGTSYVNGFRVVTGTTSKTYTASKDTYVYIDQNGTFQYEEVALGAEQPTDPANSLILAKVVTDGTAITGVTDMRRTTPANLRIYQDYKNGAVLSRDVTTATDVQIWEGEIEFGSGATSGGRRNTGIITIDTTSTGRNGLDTGSLAEGYYYVWAYPDPDNTTEYEALASTSSTSITAVTDVDDERLIGWFYASSASAVSPDSIGAYRRNGGDAPNSVKRIMNTDISTTSTSIVPIPGLETKFYSSGRPVRITLTGNMTLTNPSTNEYLVAISIDSAALAAAKQTTEYAAEGQDESSVSAIAIVWEGSMEAGEHNIIPKYMCDGGTLNLNGASDGETRLIVEEL